MFSNNLIRVHLLVGDRFLSLFIASVTFTQTSDPNGSLIVSSKPLEDRGMFQFYVICSEDINGKYDFVIVLSIDFKVQYLL